MPLLTDRERCECSTDTFRCASLFVSYSHSLSLLPRAPAKCPAIGEIPMAKNLVVYRFVVDHLWHGWPCVRVCTALCYARNGRRVSASTGFAHRSPIVDCHFVHKKLRRDPEFPSLYRLLLCLNLLETASEVRFYTSTVSLQLWPSWYALHRGKRRMSLANRPLFAMLALQASLTDAKLDSHTHTQSSLPIHSRTIQPTEMRTRIRESSARTSKYSRTQLHSDNSPHKQFTSTGKETKL